MLEGVDVVLSGGLHHGVDRVQLNFAQPPNNFAEIVTVGRGKRSAIRVSGSALDEIFSQWEGSWRAWSAIRLLLMVQFLAYFPAVGRELACLPLALKIERSLKNQPRLSMRNQTQDLPDQVHICSVSPLSFYVCSSSSRVHLNKDKSTGLWRGFLLRITHACVGDRRVFDFHPVYDGIEQRAHR